MPEPQFHVNGFRPEPDNEKHWIFEDKLLARMRVPAMATQLGNVDLRPHTSPRHNQGRTGSCVAQSVVKALEVKRIMQYGREAHVDLSVMAVYYLSRSLMLPGETRHDDGTFVSLACDVLRRFGVCADADWPFDLDNLFKPVSWTAMRKAYVNRIDSFYKIRSDGEERVNYVAKCLMAGNPVVFGTNVGHNWTRYRKGQVLGPVSDSKRTGRHATCLLGYVDGKFIGENSWGTGWGDDGFYLAETDLIADATSRDFWVIMGGWEALNT